MQAETTGINRILRIHFLGVLVLSLFRGSFAIRIFLGLRALEFRVKGFGVLVCGIRLGFVRRGPWDTIEALIRGIGLGGGGVLSSTY